MDRQADPSGVELSAGMRTPIGTLDRTLPVYIAGHRGLVGSALVRKFEAEDSRILLCGHMINSTLRTVPRRLTLSWSRGPR